MACLWRSYQLSTRSNYSIQYLEYLDKTCMNLIHLQPRLHWPDPSIHLVSRSVMLARPNLDSLGDAPYLLVTSEKLRSSFIKFTSYSFHPSTFRLLAVLARGSSKLTALQRQLQQSRKERLRESVVRTPRQSTTRHPFSQRGQTLS